MEEFEKWAIGKELDIQHNRRGEGYNFIETQLFWECWQAARQSVQKCPECDSEVVVCMMGHYCGEVTPLKQADAHPENG